MTDRADVETQEQALEAAVQALLAGFYADVRADPLLGPLFETRLHGKWETHMPRIADFWLAVLLRSRRYSGNVYGTHMQLEGVTRAHVRRWLELWIQHVRRWPNREQGALLETVALRIGRTLADGWFPQGSGYRPGDDGVVEVRRG